MKSFADKQIVIFVPDVISITEGALPIMIVYGLPAPCFDWKTMVAGSELCKGYVSRSVERKQVMFEFYSVFDY